MTSNCNAPTVPMILRPLRGACEQLRHALVHQLVDAFGQLLEFQRIGVLDVAELLGGEGGDAREAELLAFGEGVADLEVARVVQTHDVARVGEVDHRLFSAMKAVGEENFSCLPLRTCR